MSRPSCCRSARAGNSPDRTDCRGAVPRQCRRRGTIWEWLRGVQPFGPLVRSGGRRGWRCARLPLAAGISRRDGEAVGSTWCSAIRRGRSYSFLTRNISQRVRPDIAALTGAGRKKAIDELEHADPKAFFDFNIAKREFEAGNEFARASGRFHRTARGKVNTYALFAELFSHVAAPSGRAGAIVPTGIVTDYSTRLFFDNLMEKGRLVSALMFDNAWKIFPAIHSDTPFALLTIGKVVHRSRTRRTLSPDSGCAPDYRSLRRITRPRAGMDPLDDAGAHRGGAGPVDLPLDRR